jgi:hypothetical protein
LYSKDKYIRKTKTGGWGSYPHQYIEKSHILRNQWEDLMQNYRLATVHNDETLFEGRFYSFKACLEDAIKRRINLRNINLRQLNLSNANLDNAVMPDADFSGTNLTGANISESYLKGAKFVGSALYNTFFCDSNISDCDFEAASFGATDLHGAMLVNARFSTLSCFSLDFVKVRHMSNCLFVDPDGHISNMSRPPIVIRGLGREPVIFMDRDIRAGHNRLDPKRLGKLLHRISRREIGRRLGRLQSGHR